MRIQDCGELEEITLPEAVQTIDNMAFAGCEKLGKVRLPAHEIEIVENAFGRTILTSTAETKATARSTARSP